MDALRVVSTVDRPHAVWRGDDGIPATVVRGAVVVTPRGCIEAATMPGLRHRLCDLLWRPRPRLVINLSGVTSCDAIGMALLEGMSRHGADRGGWVRLAKPQRGVQRQLRDAGLFFHETIGAALAPDLSMHDS